MCKLNTVVYLIVSVWLFNCFLRRNVSVSSYLFCLTLSMCYTTWKKKWTQFTERCNHILLTLLLPAIAVLSTLLLLAVLLVCDRFCQQGRNVMLLICKLQHGQHKCIYKDADCLIACLDEVTRLGMLTLYDLDELRLTLWLVAAVNDIKPMLHCRFEPVDSWAWWGGSPAPPLSMAAHACGWG